MEDCEVTHTLHSMLNTVQHSTTSLWIKPHRGRKEREQEEEIERVPTIVCSGQSVNCPTARLRLLQGCQLSHPWHCITCLELVLILLTLMVVVLTALWVAMGKPLAPCTDWLTYKSLGIMTLCKLSGHSCQRQTPVIINELMVAETMQHHLNLLGLGGVQECNVPKLP